MAIGRKDSQASLLQQSEGSALRNVFGSEVSLAELNGDVPSAQASRSSSPKPFTCTAVPATARGAPADCKTKSNVKFEGLSLRSRRYSVPHQHARPVSPPPRMAALRPKQLRAAAIGIIIVLLAGVINSVLFLRWLTVRHFDTVLGFDVTPQAVPTAALLALCAFGLSVVLPLVDAYSPKGMPDAKHRGAHAGEWSAFVRATGMLLGLTYALSKVSGAWLFWGLANPCLWYLTDRSLNGLVLSLSLSTGLTLLLAFVCKTPWQPSAEQASALAAVAAAVFSVAISFGNLGRSLFSPRADAPSQR